MILHRSDSRRGRLASGACILLHLLVVGLVPLADASLEAASYDQQVHVETDRDAPCAPGHNHLVCQLCRVIGLEVAAPASSPRVAVTSALRALPAVDPFAVLPGTVAHSPLGPRAPPVA